MVSARKHDLEISIHAPREGGDEGTMPNNGATSLISIHAPREGGDWTAALA